jgi:peptidoglycan-associated lipoprotein
MAPERYPHHSPLREAVRGAFYESISEKRRRAMFKKSFVVLVIILSVGIVGSGCPKKTVVKEDPFVFEQQRMKAEAERIAARREAERREMEAREAARLKEEEARKELARRELASKEQAKKDQGQKEFEKSLVTKRTPGIEGEVFESKLLKDIFFGFDRYEIDSEEATILKDNAAFLTKYPNVKIQVEGHCDERGTVEYNLALGERRANSARNYLTSIGIPESRISTISFGEESPADAGHNEEAWAKNRRAHFVLLSK